MADQGARTTVSRMRPLAGARSPEEVNFALFELGYQRRPTEEEQAAEPGLKWIPTEKGEPHCTLKRKVAGKTKEAWLTWDLELALEVRDILRPAREQSIDALKAQVEALEATILNLAVTVGEIHAATAGVRR